MYPSRVGSEDGQSISWPETVGFVPASHIWLTLAHVGVEVIQVELPVGNSTLRLEVLSENLSPLIAANLIIEDLGGLSNVHLGDI